MLLAIWNTRSSFDRSKFEVGPGNGGGFAIGMARDGTWMDIFVGSKVLEGLNGCSKNWLCYTALSVFVMVH